MPEHELREQSKVILNALGESFAKAFSTDGTIDAEAIDSLMEALDEVNIPREVALESACQRTSKLLSNTANKAVK